MREKWLDRIRGVAIIAVVTEHLMGYVHHTEIIQVTTIFCVCVLIICMGITQAWGYKKAFATGAISKNGDIAKYLFRRMLPILCALCLGTIAYLTYHRQWVGVEINFLLERIFWFDAAGPLYFLRHYFNLTLLSPALYYVITVINGLPNKWAIMIGNTVFLLVCFGIGYWSIGRLEIFGQSYLTLYALGMIWGGGRMQTPEQRAFGSWSFPFPYWDSFFSKILLGTSGWKL